MTFPVILGSGKRLFPDNAEDKKPLKLASTQPVGNDGVVIYTYEPVRD
jgi:hypothetical protein